MRWACPDAEVRKPGEQTGLDTPVVLAINYGYWIFLHSCGSVEANALSIPPGEYGRKIETQRN